MRHAGLVVVASSLATVACTRDFDACPPNTVATDGECLVPSDENPSDRERASTIRSSGVGAGREFADLSAFVAERAGDLTARVLVTVSAESGSASPGSRFTTPTCSATLIGDPGANELTLELQSGRCEVGQTLSGDSYSAVLNSVSAKGVIERVEFAAGTHGASLILPAAFITNERSYVWLTAAPSERHLGVPGAGAVIDPVIEGHAVVVEQPHTRVSWLEIVGWLNSDGLNSFEGVHAAAAPILLENLLIHDDAFDESLAAWTDDRKPNPNADGINLNDVPAGGRVVIRGCLIYNISRSGISQQGATGGSDILIENTTIFRAARSGNQADGEAGLFLQRADALIEINNTAVLATCLDALAPCRNGSPFDFYVAGPSAGANNLSSDSTAIGDRAIRFVEPSVMFVDPTFGSEDLHLRSDSPSVDAGTIPRDSTEQFDIHGETRPKGDAWDIGADELAIF